MSDTMRNVARKKSKKHESLLPTLPTIAIKPETLRSIYAVLAAICALLFILAAIGKAGHLGDFLYGELKERLFGVGYFLIPVSLVFLTIGLFRQHESEGVGGVRVTGAAILFLAGIGILSTFGESGYGGVVGHWIAYPFVSLFDVFFSVVALFAIGVVGALLALDTALGLPTLSLWPLSKKAEKGLTVHGSAEEDKGPEDEDGEPDDGEEEVLEEPKRGLFEKKTPALSTVADTPEASGITFRAIDTAYNAPPLSILERDKGKPAVGDIKANANIIKRTLANFGIEVEMDEVSIGPSVTRYALKPAEGVRLQKILGLQNNLELALAASPVRIEAPIPGKSLVGIEVPNQKKATVGLASIFADRAFADDRRPLLAALGRDIAGMAHFTNIAKMPHLLIAGATGSGKSVAIHALITSLLYRNGPATLRLIMVDPKRVELTTYNPIPHLLTPVITDPKKAILALKWAAKEMERRYELLEKHAVRDIASYHENVVGKAQPSADGAEGPDQMPYIVIIVDELADIMQAYPRELEASIVRLAQMSRAVGIHLVISTQRPSVNVITGIIKANIPARIALQVASQIDSRTILDAAGAEKLLGAGDMLYLAGDMAKPHRIQTAFISEDEVKKVVDYIKKNNEAPLDQVALSGNATASPNAIFSATLEDDDVDDDLFAEAKATVESAGKASTSFLQRKLRIGYARAARLMDLLEEKGIIGPGDGAKPREVLTVGGGSGSAEEEPEEE